MFAIDWNTTGTSPTAFAESPSGALVGARIRVAVAVLTLLS
jgi:hypothetical protein